MITDFLFVLDRSGSMRYDHKWDRLVEGVRAQILAIKEDSESSDAVNRVSIMILDEIVQPMEIFKVDAASIDAEKFLEGMHPGGSTPLFDAFGTGVVRLEQEDDGEADHAYVVQVFTDGQENASHLYDGPMLDRNIKRLTENGRWTFTWAIDEADFEYARKTFSSMSASNMTSFSNTGIGVAEAVSANIGGTRSYLAQRHAGATQTNDWYAPTTGTVTTDYESMLVIDKTVAPPENWG